MVVSARDGDENRRLESRTLLKLAVGLGVGVWFTLTSERLSFRILGVLTIVLAAGGLGMGMLYRELTSDGARKR
jgi:hypothetical protein